MKTLVRKNIFYKSALDDQTTGAKIDKMFGDRGVFGGGGPPFVNTIDYISISTTGDATDFSDLIQSHIPKISGIARCCYGNVVYGVYNGARVARSTPPEDTSTTI